MRKILLTTSGLESMYVCSVSFAWGTSQVSVWQSAALIPRIDPGSNPGGDQQTYLSSADRLASFVTQAIGGQG